VGLVSQGVFWFSVLCMAATAVAMMLILISTTGKRPPWMKYFLIHIGAYTFWLLVHTFLFFNVEFLPDSPGGVEFFVGTVHMLVSLTILLSYPPFIFKVIGSENRVKPRVLALVSSAVLVVFLFATYFFSLPGLSLVLNLLFNLYLFAMSLLGYRTLRTQQLQGLRKTMARYLGITVYLYALLIVATPFVLITPMAWRPAIGLLFTAFFSLVWSILIIFELLSHSERVLGKVTLSEGFLTDYRISGREREVLEKLIQGKPNKAIADELFISTRTVEAHVYSIYRKCGVSNKVELIRILENT
jgi:DNA-binding CsgD family transcriptional regulator